MLNRHQIFFRFVLFSDEAIFHNTGQLNRHNSLLVCWKLTLVSKS